MTCGGSCGERGGEDVTKSWQWTETVRHNLCMIADEEMKADTAQQMKWKKRCISLMEYLKK